MDSKIWLSSPHMGGKEQSYVNKAFETNWIAPLGPHVNGFESDLQNYLKEDSHVAVLSSGYLEPKEAFYMQGLKARTKERM